MIYWGEAGGLVITVDVGAIITVEVGAIINIVKNIIGAQDKGGVVYYLSRHMDR
jgi:hypothetical protein